jgi:hypothetical protein
VGLRFWPRSRWMGVPENLALGTSLATGVSLSMLVAIFFVSSVAIIDASRRLVE